MIIVLDTNVIVSALLSPEAPPDRILRLCTSAKIRIAHDPRILAEYRRVLAHPRFGFDADLADAILEQIELKGQTCQPLPLPQRLNHVADEKFLEVAIASGARCLVTKTLKHFPRSKRCGVEVLSPRQFIELLRHEGF